MAGLPTLSQGAFSSGDYDDGEIKRLVVGSPLWVALMNELWLNCSSETQTYYRQLMIKPSYFIGTITSVPRRQVELTIVPLQSDLKSPGNLEQIAISLDNIHRFI